MIIEIESVLTMAKIMKLETIALLAACTILSVVVNAQQLPNEIQMSDISENLVSSDESYAPPVTDSL